MRGNLSLLKRVGIVMAGVAGALGVVIPAFAMAQAAQASIGTSTQLAGYTASIPATSNTALKMRITVSAVTCPTSGTAA